MNNRGSALAETAFFFMTMAVMIGGMIAFAQGFVIRQKLISGTRQAALLYSSGRFTVPQVEFYVRRFMTRGSPKLEGSRFTILCRRRMTPTGRLNNLDEVVLSYSGQGPMRRFFPSPMVERLVIKHTAKYPTDPLGQVER
jgi:hypothetical protein